MHELKFTKTRKNDIFNAPINNIYRFKIINIIYLICIKEKILLIKRKALKEINNHPLL